MPGIAVLAGTVKTAGYTPKTVIFRQYLRYLRPRGWKRGSSNGWIGGYVPGTGTYLTFHPLPEPCFRRPVAKFRIFWRVELYSRVEGQPRKCVLGVVFFLGGPKAPPGCPGPFWQFLSNPWGNPHGSDQKGARTAFSDKRVQKGSKGGYPRNPSQRCTTEGPKVEVALHCWRHVVRCTRAARWRLAATGCTAPDDPPTKGAAPLNHLFSGYLW